MIFILNKTYFFLQILLIILVNQLVSKA